MSHDTHCKKTCSPMLRTVSSLAAILVGVTGCGQAPDPSSTATDTPNSVQIVQNARRPEITTEKIAADVVGKKVSISELTGDGPDDEWTFEGSEFRQVNILEKTVTNSGVTLVVFMTTKNNPASDQVQIHVSGKLELQYEWKAGQWDLTHIKNLTFRYTIGVPT